MFDSLLKDLYYNLKNDTAYSSKKNLYQKAKSINNKITWENVAPVPLPLPLRPVPIRVTSLRRRSSAGGCG